MPARTAGNRKALFALTALYQSSLILPVAASRALTAPYPPAAQPLGGRLIMKNLAERLVAFSCKKRGCILSVTIFLDSPP